MILYDPGYCPTPKIQTIANLPRTVPEPRFPLDREIVNFLRGQSEPVSPWTMASSVARSMNLKSRSERREMTIRLMSRITRLIHLQYVRKVGRKYITLR